jgi:uncharacterized repeat protein (TIGR02543 family)
MKKITILLMAVCIFTACKMDSSYVTVTLDCNGGSIYEEEIWYLLYYKGATIEDLEEDPIHDNYLFDGWYTDNDTFIDKWDFSNPITEDITLYAKWRDIKGIEEFTSSTTWIVPAGVTLVDVFCVGGGGSGAGDFGWVNQSGSGGNGGVVTFTRNVSVTPGRSIQITVGAGGVSGKRFNGASGGSSSFGNSVVSAGGYGGVNGQPDKQVNYGDTVNDEGQPADEEENSGRGGRRGSTDGSSTDLQGGDGIECPFYSTGNKYGAGGAGANTAYMQTSLQQYGGDTGGGNSGYGEDNTPENRGSDATFYGGGGGGGAFSSNHTHSLGGNGSAGIVIIRY